MFSNGTIQKFGYYNDFQLTQMKSDLGIDMALPKLKLCASYFREKALRDPFIEELRFLDLFVQKASHSPVSVAPKELFTNDAYVAQTYADLIEKRRATNPDAKKPVSLEEAFQLMGQYLERIGKARLLAHEAYFFEDLRKNPVSREAENVISVQGAGCGLHRAFCEKRPFESSDLLVVLTASKETLPIKASARYSAFWSDTANLFAAKEIRTIGECGILYEALQMAEGVVIDLDALSTQCDAPHLSSLVTSHIGGYLFRIDRQAYDFLAKSAKSVGLQVLAVATVADPTTVAITQNGRLVLAWPLAFIRSLFAFSPVSMQLANEAEGAGTKIKQCRHLAGECTYLELPQADLPQTKAVCGNNLYTFSFSAPQSGFFRNAIDTVLSTVITACACGIPYSEQRLAIWLDLPFCLSNCDTASAAMSSILGLYRIEAELAIPMALGKLSHSASLSTPEIGVFGFSKGTPLADRFCQAGHRLYCVMPEYDANSIPNFDQLRRFLDWLTELSQSGVLKGARVFSQQTLSEALKEMETVPLQACFANGVENDSRVLPLAVILETDSEISAELVGTIQARPLVESKTETAELPLRAHCLLPIKDPAVLIYAMPDDRDAQILAAKFEKEGACTYLFTPNDAPLLIASKLYQVQTLILCGKAQLPNTPEVSFAAETLAKANGLFLHLGGKNCGQSALSFIDLDVLSKQNLEQICKITNN